MGRLTQANREVAIHTPLGDDVLLIQSMQGREELGKLFEYQVEMTSETTDIDFNALVGDNITVSIKMPDDSLRYFNGYVSRFAQVDVSGHDGSYQATMVPWLWFLTRTADCRIFQEKTVPDIIDEVFRDAGFSDFEAKLSASYRTWEYCVQYRETDFNFVSRLMEQEGIYYYFTHEEGKHKLVLCDAYSSHEKITNYEEIPYYPPSDSTRRERDHINDWSLSQQLQPGSYVLNDFDFKAPKKDLLAKSKQSRDHVKAEYEIYDYPGEYIEYANGESYAGIRLAELQSQHELAYAQGDARGISSGALFKLTNYPRADQNKEYLIVSASYSIEAGEYGAGQGSGAAVYSCSCSVMDAQQAFRCPRSTPKPMVQGPQTAIVVGKSGEEIWTDKYGRVKVQFHWDRYGESDENSSCWIRASHPWAGKNWGSVAIPRIGQEVIVSFLEGDPDQPIITGRVYNDDQMPPFELPGQAMVSGTKSNTTPGGGGYNEIALDDTSGEELIRVHGQFDMDSTIENDLREHVLNNRSRDVAVDESVSIGNNKTIDVGVDHTESIGSNMKLDVGSNQDITVGSSKTETVSINKAETIGIAKELTIGGAYQVTVGAAMNETVGGLKAEEIGGLKSVNVGGNSSENIGGNKSVDAGKDISETASKNISEQAGDNVSSTAGKDTAITSGKKMSLTAGDDFAISGGKKGVIDIADELTIKCGKAVIVMKKNGDVTINGNKITIKGSGDVILKGQKVLQN